MGVARLTYHVRMSVVFHRKPVGSGCVTKNSHFSTYSSLCLAYLTYSVIGPQEHLACSLLIDHDILLVHMQLIVVHVSDGSRSVGTRDCSHALGGMTFTACLRSSTGLHSALIRTSKTAILSVDRFSACSRGLR